LDLISVALVVAATFAWAVTWILMRMGVGRMHWIDFGFLRPLVSLPLVALYAWVTDGFVFGGTELILVGLAGGVLNAFVGTALFYYAHTHGAMHETNILANTGPFWGVVSAIAVLGEPARWATFGAGVLVIAGTILLVRGRPSKDAARHLPALLAATAAGVIWGFSSAVPTKFCMAGGMSPIAYQFLFTVAAVATWSLSIAPRAIRRKVRVGRQHLWVVVVSSVLGIVVGWVLWLAAIQRTDASLLSPLSGLTLLFAVVLGVVFFRERVTPKILAGGGLVIAGVTLVSVFAR